MNLLTLSLLLLLILCQNANGVSKQSWPDVESKRDILLDDRNVDEVLVEKIIKENPSSFNNSSAFSEFVNRYLDGLMVQFRRRVFNLYRKLTCGNGFCDPWNPELDLTHSGILNRPTSLRLTINKIGPWHECTLPYSTSSYVMFKKSLKTFFATGSSDHPTVSLYEFGGDGQCQLIGNSNAMTNPCFTSFKSEEFPFLFVGPCKNWTKSAQHVDVLLITEGLERLHLIDVKNLKHMFTLEHLRNAYLFLITADDKLTQTGQLYQWVDMFFENIETFSSDLGQVVKSFSYGKESYLVSTNYESSDYSPVTLWQFVENRNSSWLKKYQVLNDCWTSDAEPFSAGGLQFLAVSCSAKSNKNESYLYWWTGSQFLMWQSVPAKNILLWTAVQLSNDDTALIMHSYENNNHILQVFQLDEGYYWPNKARLHGLFAKQSSKIQIKSIQHMGLHLLTAVENFGSRSKFTSHRLHLEILQPKMDVANNYDELSCINAISNEIQDEEIKLQNMEKALLEIQNLKSQKVIVTKEKSFKQSGKNTKCEDLNFHLSNIENKISEAERQSRLYTEQERYTDHDSMVVNRLTVRGSMETRDVLVKSGMISRVDLSDLQRTVVSKTKDQIFNASVTFQGGLNTLFLDICSTLNGERIAGNFAINGGRNTFTKPQHFQSLNVDNLHLTNTVNNIKLSSIVLKSGRQTIHGKKTIKRLIARQNLLLHKGEINGVNIEAFFNRTLTISGDQFISGPITFLGNVTIDGDIVCSTINDINLNNLAKKVVTTNTPQKIIGKKQFMAAMIVGNSTLFGKLNDVEIPKDVLTKYTRQTIFGDITIDGDVIVKKNLGVKGTVNDEILSRILVTRCGNHTITGKKEFRDMVTAKEFRDLNSGDVWQYFGDLTVDHLEAVEVKGIDLKHLNHLMRKSKPQTFNGSLQCNSVIFKDLIVGNLNGGRLENMYITTRTNQTIFTPLIIKNDAFISGAARMKELVTINGVDISELPHYCVMKTGDQIIRGHKIFHNVQTLGGLKVKTLNGSESTGILQHLLQKEKIDTITVHGNVDVHDDLNSDFLNGRHLNSFLTHIYKTDQSISLSGKLFKNLIVKGNLHLNTNLNGINVTDFFMKVIRLSTDQVITGNVEFLKPVRSSGPTLVKTVNGEILEKQINRLVQVDAENRINVPITLKNGVKVNGSVNTELLNGRNISQFMRNVLVNTGFQQFGPTFVNGNLFIGDIKVTEINGHKTSDFVLVNQSASFDAAVFNAPVSFISLRLNSTNLSQESIVPIFKTLKATSIVLKGTLNNFYPSDLPNLVLSKTSAQNFSTTDLVFDSDVSVGRLSLKRPFINDVNLDDFRQRAVMTDKKQIITGKKTWESTGNLTMTEDVLVTGDVTTSVITGIDINVTKMSMVDEVIEVFQKGGIYYGDIIFNGKVEIKGLINGIDFPKNLILKNVPQTFATLNFNGDVKVNTLTVTGDVNGINLEALIRNRITLSTKQNISANIKFHDVADIKGFAPCQVDPCPVEKTIPNEYKHILEPVSFDCPVVIGGSVESHYPLNIDLQNQAREMSGRNNSECFRSLLRVAKELSSEISYFEIANHLLASHSIIHINHNDNVYFLLATQSISPWTCNNIKIFRCDNKIVNCHQSKGILKLPKGFVKKMYAFEQDGLTNVAYVMEGEGLFGLNPPHCPNLFDGVFVFKDILEKTRAYFLIPASKITGISILGRHASQLHVLLSSYEFGIKIYALEKNSPPLTIAAKEGGTIDIAILKPSRNLFVFELARRGPELKLAANEWVRTESKIEDTFEVLVPKTAKHLLAFKTTNRNYITISSDTVKVYLLGGSSIIEVQEMLHVAKDLKEFEYSGRVYLLILDESDEMFLYKWTDLLHFVLVTRINFFYPVDVLYPFISVEELFIVASSNTNREMKRSSTVIYKAITSGHSLEYIC